MNVLKELSIFAAGAAVGAVAAHLYLKEKYEKEAQEKIAQMKHFHEREIEKLTAKEKVEETKEEPKSDPAKFSSLKADSEAKKDYHAISNIYSTSEELKEKLVDMRNNEHPEDDRPTEPYAISQDDFVYTEDDYEKLPLSFYIYDESLVDENEELAEVDNTIGKECYQILCAQKPDTFWVRNPRIGVDFEIFAVEGSYKEEILGEE